VLVAPGRRRAALPPSCDRGRPAIAGGRYPRRRPFGRRSAHARARCAGPRRSHFECRSSPSAPRPRTAARREAATSARNAPAVGIESSVRCLGATSPRR
jgi:hypothetical protein